MPTYGYYDLVMSVSPADANTLYCGGYELVKSIDGGNTWNIADNVDSFPANNYIHADKHAVTFIQFAAQKYYVALMEVYLKQMMALIVGVILAMG